MKQAVTNYFAWPRLAYKIPADANHLIEKQRRRTKPQIIRPELPAVPHKSGGSGDEGTRFLDFLPLRAPHLVKHSINQRRRRPSFISASASSFMARSATSNQFSPPGARSTFDPATPKHGTTSAPLTISSAATRKRPLLASRRCSTGRTTERRGSICNTGVQD